MLKASEFWLFLHSLTIDMWLYIAAKYGNGEKMGFLKYISRE